MAKKVTKASSASTAIGYQSASTAIGYQSAALNVAWLGRSRADGAASVAIATGYMGSCRAADGNPIFLIERSKDGAILSAWHGFAGQDGIKPNTYYRLLDGNPVEIEDEADD